MAWALERLDEPLELAALAAPGVHERPHVHAPLPPRDRDDPGRWLLEQRVRASLPLLEAADAPIETVAGARRLRERGDLPAPLRRDHADVTDGLPAGLLRGRRA